MISSASFRTTRLQAWSECVNSNHCMRPTTLTASSSMSMKKKKINAAYTSNLETIPEDINYSFSSTSNGTSNSRFAPNPRKAELEAEEEESTEPTSVSSLTLSMDGIGNQKLETKMLLSTSSTSVTNSNSRCSTLNNKPLGLKPYPIKSTAIELTSFPTHPSLYTSLSDPRPLHVSSLLKKNQSLLNTIMNALEPGIQQDTFNTILYTCRKKMPDLPWVHRLATFLYDVPPILNAFLHLIGWVGGHISLKTMKPYTLPIAAKPFHSATSSDGHGPHLPLHMDPERFNESLTNSLLLNPHLPSSCFIGSKKKFNPSLSPSFSLPKKVSMSLMTSSTLDQVTTIHANRPETSFSSSSLLDQPKSPHALEATKNTLRGERREGILQKSKPLPISTSNFTSSSLSHSILTHFELSKKTRNRNTL